MNAAVTRMTFGQLGGGIRARCAERGRSRIVGVDGMSGAGETGFAQRLAAELGAPCLCTDDFVPGWDGLEESVRLLVNWVLRPLAEGRPARWQRYDWMTGCPGDWVGLPGTEFVVVEGCCVGLPAAAAYLSYLVWVETQPAQRPDPFSVRPINCRLAAAAAHRSPPASAAADPR
jgi:hypothetical protein